VTAERRCRAWLATAAVALLASCAAKAARAPLPCAATPDPVAAICARDGQLDSLRARFRATVGPIDAAKDGARIARRTAEGVMLLQAPRAMRVKLFTLAGITVLDALWVGTEDGGAVRGLVRSPLRGATQQFEVRAGEPIADPDAAMSFALWSLWQKRCAAPPRPLEADPQRFTLDPGSALALRREAAVGSGVVREEILVRPGPSGGEAPEQTIVATFGEYDCALVPPLARDVELEAPEQGWQARVHILEVATGEPLDPQLFAFPSAPAQAAAAPFAGAGG
jgi:hypothetical protein